MAQDFHLSQLVLSTRARDRARDGIPCPSSVSGRRLEADTDTGRGHGFKSVTVTVTRTERNGRLGQHSGQAMVELVIILIFIMAMCAGMVASTRLLGFQFWAQQEARYLAFEQEWTAHDFYGDPVNDPITKLSNGKYFGRSPLVSGRTTTKNVADDPGGLPDLLSWLVPAATDDSAARQPIGGLDSSPQMFAKNERWWQGRSSEWIAPGGALEQAFSTVQTAFASRDVDRSIRSVGLRADEMPQNPGDAEDQGDYRDRLKPRIRDFLKSAGVGPRTCDALQAFSKRNGSPEFLQPFRGASCAGKVEEGLAENLAENVDIKDFFRGYGELIQSGFTAGGALEVSVREEVATQFYSLFDTIVKQAVGSASSDLSNGRTQSGLAFSDASFGRMKSDARYAGSAAALTAINDKAGSINNFDTNNEDSDKELAFEKTITDMLDVEAAETITKQSPFNLDLKYLPVPPTFGATMGGLQEGVMRNLMLAAEDSDEHDEQIDNANKLVEVTYLAQGGLFQLATSKIRGAEAASLTGRFYLVTQPWHLKRREGKTGAYRQKGKQIDTSGDETEEAVMRRRVLNLFIFPADAPALLEPIALIPGLSFLKPIINAFEPVAGIINRVRDFITNKNPLFDIAQALSEIPVIGDLIPVPPVFPAVRPDAYPGSVEMTGSKPEDPDMLMGSKRNFSDYVDEQRDNDPDPRPKFN